MIDRITLDTGRVVWIEEISIQNTYGDFLGGHPHAISDLIWQRTPEDLRPIHGETVHILKPPGPVLPNYRFVARLESDPLPDEDRWRPACVPGNLPFGHPWEFSAIALCWFQHGLDGRLTDLVYQATRGLEWEKIAKNLSA